MNARFLFGFVYVALAAANFALAQSATPADQLNVPPGFKVELLKSAAKHEGSWISMAIDDKGRLYISPQGAIPESGFSRESKWGGIWRVTLDDKGQIAQWEKVPVPIGDSMGMLWAFDSLYVSGNGPEGRGIYRLMSEGTQDRLDSWALFKKVPGGAGEHGAHALVVGPDKKIYIAHGNSTPLIDGIDPHSPYRSYAEDDLLPRIMDPVATFFDKLKAPYGYILRTDEKGTKWELFAGGFRNQYDIDFNEDGELFTYDSDMEWDVGLPWYRPTRILHVVSGAEFGFREGTSKWPAYYPDSLPSVVDIGLGSPTGVKFGTRSNFPEKYRRAFFAMDWTYGRILAVHMRPKGASYTAENETAAGAAGAAKAEELDSSRRDRRDRRGEFYPKGAEAGGDVEVFLQGKGMPVTDLEFGKDGAMYFTIGGRGTQAGLYRVSWTGEQADEERPGFLIVEKKARAIRRGLEEEHTQRNANEIAWDSLRLGAGDRHIRNAGRVALESYVVPLWRDRALAETESRPGLTALLALARVGTKDDQAAILKALGKWPLDSLDDELKLLKLRVIALCFIRHGRPSDELAAVAIEKLSKQYPAKTFALNRELSQLLVWLGAPDVVEKSLALMDSVADPAEQVWYALVLREASGWTPEQRERYFTWFGKNADFKGGNSAKKFLGRIKDLALAKIPDAERGHFAALAERKAEPPEPAGSAAPRPFVQNWTVADLAADLDKLGAGRDLARGKAAYLAAQCAGCHLFRGEGGNIGPDLTAASNRFNRRDLLEAIIDPNKGISEQYAMFHVTQFDGKKEVAGMIVEDTNDFLKVLVDPLRGTTEMISKYNPPKKELLPTSPMPPGLINTLTKDEVLDLLAFIESGAK